MNLTREQARLKLSVEQIIERADFKATERISKEADSRGLKAMGSNGHALDVVRISYEVIEEALPELFKAYDAERSRLWVNRHQLDYLLRVNIKRYYEGGRRHMLPSVQLLLSEGQKFITQAWHERETLTLARVEEHFRHPGILPPHQRHAIAFAIAMAVLGVILATLGRVLVQVTP